MRVVPPLEITPARLTSSTCAEPHSSETEYDIGDTYAAGDRVVSVEAHRTYESLEDGNVGNDLTDETKWADVGPTLRYAMFDLDRNTSTTDDGPLEVVVTPGERVDALGLVGIVADSVEVEVSVPAAGGTNLLLYSDDLTGPSWTNYRTTSAPPYSLFETAETYFHQVLQSIAFEAGTYCFSCYVKPAGRDWAYLRENTADTGWGATYFDIAAGEVGTIAAGRTAGIEGPDEDGWCRIWISAVAPSDGGTEYQVGIATGDNAAEFLGDITKGIEVRRAQLEPGTSPGTYAATTDSPVEAPPPEVVYSYSADLTTREVGTWYEYATTPFETQTSLVLFDLPPFTAAVITVTLDREDGEVSCAGAVLGRAVYMGEVEHQPVSDTLNFSKVERDEFGNAALVRRRNVPTVDLTVWAAKALVKKLLLLRDTLNAAPALWCGLDDAEHGYFEAVLILGIYKRFAIGLDHPEDAKISLTLEEI